MNKLRNVSNKTGSGQITGCKNRFQFSLQTLYQKFDYVKYLASLDRDARTNASKSSVKWPLLALKFGLSVVSVRVFKCCKNRVLPLSVVIFIKARETAYTAEIFLFCHHIVTFHNAMKIFCALKG